MIIICIANNAITLCILLMMLIMIIRVVETDNVSPLLERVTFVRKRKTCVNINPGIYAGAMKCMLI